MAKFAFFLALAFMTCGIFWALAGQNFVDTQAAFSNVLAILWTLALFLAGLGALIEL